MKKYLCIIVIAEICTSCVTGYELFTAIHKKDHETAIGLLVSGENPNLRNKKGHVPLWEATRLDDIESVNILINNGADASLTDSTPFAYATALGLATSRIKNLEIAQLLIDNGADVNQKGHYNQTPIFDAVAHGYVPGVEFLIKNGANVNAKSTLGETPLIRALLYKNPDVAKLLIENGAETFVSDQFGRSPLSIAEKNGFNDIVERIKK
jgi:ankyrin repeat protein